MEIKLSEQDLDALAVRVVGMIKQKCVNAAMSTVAYEGMVNAARNYADIHIKKQNFKFEVKAAIIAHLRQDRVIENAMEQAIQKVIGGDEALLKLAREHLRAAIETAYENLVERFRE